MISVIKPYPQSKVKSSSSPVDNEKRKIKKVQQDFSKESKVWDYLSNCSRSNRKCGSSRGLGRFTLSTWPAYRSL